MKIIGNLQVYGSNSKIQLNSNPQTNLEYSGFITNEYVGENVSIGKALYYDPSTYLWKLALANSLSTLPCRGIALENKTTNQLCKILKYGTLRIDNYTFNTFGIYISSTVAGDLVTTPPNTSGHFVQLIGSPVNEHVAHFDFNPLCIEIS